MAESKEKNTTGNIMDPEEQIRQFAHGRLELSVPIQDGQETINVLEWDFLALTGAEYCDALDSDKKAGNTFRITNTQALCLFATAAAKKTKGLNAEDIRRRIGIMDAQKATQLATVFFTASNQAGYRRILNA